MRKGLSERELSKISNVSKTAINDIENKNENANPTMKTVGRLAAALGIKPEELFNFSVYH